MTQRCVNAPQAASSLAWDLFAIRPRRDGVGSRFVFQSSALLCALCLALAGASAQAPPAKGEKLTSEQRQSLLQERDRLWKEADALDNQDKLPEAIAALEQALAIDRRLSGNTHRDVAKSLQWIARLRERREEFDTAEKLRTEVLAIRKARHGQDHWEVTNARLALDHVGLLKKLTPPQRQQLTEASDRNRQVLAFGDRGAYAKAVPSALIAFNVRKEILGEEHPQTLTSLSTLGWMYRDSGDYASAEPLLRECQLLRKKVLGERHPDYALSLNVLGWLHHKKEEWAKAEACFREARDVYAQTVGQKHNDFKTTLDNLVELHVAMAAQSEKRDEFDAAEKSRGEVLTLRKELLAESHWQVTDARLALEHVRLLKKLTPAQRQQLTEASDLNRQGLALRGRRDYAKAVPMALKAFNVRKEILGEEHPQTLTSQINLGWLHRELRDYSTAGSLLEQASVLSRKVFGESHPEYAISLNALGWLHHNKKEWAKAEVCFREASAIHAQTVGEKHNSFTITLNNLVTLHLAMAEQSEKRDEFDAAEKSRSEVLALRKKLLGESHWQVTDARLALEHIRLLKKLTPAQRQQLTKASELERQIAALGDRRQYAKAVPLAVEAFGIRKDILGEEHPQTLASRSDLGWMYRDSADYAKAEPLLRECSLLRKKVFGERHPDYALSLNVLGWLHHKREEWAKAEACYREAKGVYAQTVGENHNGFKTSLNNLADLRGAMAAQSEKHESADRYAEAIRVAEELLTLRQKDQGVDHWQTVNQRWHALMLKKVAVLPAEERAGWRKAAAGAAEAARLEDAERPEPAAPLWQARLNWCRRVLGEEHPHTAGAYNNVGFNLNSQLQYAAAAGPYDKALQIRLKLLGAEHPDVAHSYNNIGLNFSAQERYREAAPLLVRALKIRQKVLGEQDADTANAYNSLGYTYWRQEKFAEAAAEFKKALAIYGKVSGEDSLDAATCHNNLATCFDGLNDYKEATRQYEKALAIRRKELKEHTLVASTCHNLAYSLSEQRRLRDAEKLFRESLNVRLKLLPDKHPAIAFSHQHLANCLDNQRKHAEATPHLQAALEIFKTAVETLKGRPVDRGGFFNTYNSLALNLNEQDQYFKAGVVYQQALKMSLEVHGEEHHETAMIYNNLAGNLSDQGKHADAAAMSLRALQICQAVLDEQDERTATAYSNLAIKLNAQGRYAEAAPFYERAPKIRQDVLPAGDRAIASSYTNVGLNLAKQGQPAAALPMLEKALELFQKTNDERSIALGYSNLASVLSRVGRHGEAKDTREKALTIRLRVLGKDALETGQSHNNLASSFDREGQFAEARPHFQRYVEICQRVLGERHPDTVVARSNLAVNLMADGRHEDAAAQLVAAAAAHEAARLIVHGRGIERPFVYRDRDNLAERREEDSRSDQRAALENDSPSTTLAVVRAIQKRPQEAWEALEAGLARGLLDEAASRAGITLSQSEAKRQQDLQAEVRRVEGRILPLVTKASLSAAEQAELNELIDARARAERELSALAVALSRREVATLAEIQKALPADAAMLAWVSVFSPGGLQESWGCVVRASGPPVWQRLTGSGPGGRWTPSDRDLPVVLRNKLAGVSTQAEIHRLAEQFAARWLTPLEKHLDGVQRLFVVPHDVAADVPLEALTDRYVVSYAHSGTQLVKLQKRPRPAGSDTILALGAPVFSSPGKAKPPGELPPGGLLITAATPRGNAAKARIQSGDVLLRYAGEVLKSQEQLDTLIAAQASGKRIEVTVWREPQPARDRKEAAAPPKSGELSKAKESAAPEEAPTPRPATLVLDVASGPLDVVLAKLPAPEAVAERRKIDARIASTLRGGDWDNLPGSRVEVARLCELFGDGATPLTDSAASEQELEALRRAGRLVEFRYLHFATHGQANHAVAFESALILAQDALPAAAVGLSEKPYDGRLTANEVLDHWKLDAELVTLSACQSGLGRPAGGDGLLGFAQAFLLKGSRSVCLTLWDVHDGATALLMDRFYQNLRGRRAGLVKPMAKAAALAEAKRWLQGLTVEEATRLSAELMKGVPRGKKKLDKPLPDVPGPKDPEAAKDYRPYAHPHYWAAFVLFGAAE